MERAWSPVPRGEAINVDFASILVATVVCGEMSSHVKVAK